MKKTQISSHIEQSFTQKLMLFCLALTLLLIAGTLKVQAQCPEPDPCSNIPWRSVTHYIQLPSGCMVTVNGEERNCSNFCEFRINSIYDAIGDCCNDIPNYTVRQLVDIVTREILRNSDKLLSCYPVPGEVKIYRASCWFKDTPNSAIPCIGITDCCIVIGTAKETTFRIISDPNPNNCTNSPSPNCEFICN